MQGGVTYHRITPDGLEVSVGPDRKTPELIAVDTVVLCAGQVPQRSLSDALAAAGLKHHR